VPRLKGEVVTERHNRSKRTVEATDVAQPLGRVRMLASHTLA